MSTMTEFPIPWLVAIAAVFVAMRCLLALANRRSEHLQSLLTEHVRREKVESLKRRRIRELREKIRAKKALEQQTETKNAA